ncbi:MAG TPA: NUDIX domain-containing protein [Cyclobacteriaceae bacterium]|nr:NUDIX domain-containing protein [Cyclobacteriaceae bacterium]
MNEQIDKLFGGKVRVRACGLCWEDSRLLLVNHKDLTSGDFWAPPGGGVDFGESIGSTLMHEFRDETGLIVEPGEFRFVCEFINPPLHAIELFFDVMRISGQIKIGTDPEMPDSCQILSDIRYMKYDEILFLPANERHGLFNLFQNEKDLKMASGYHKI